MWTNAMNRGVERQLMNKREGNTSFGLFVKNEKQWQREKED